MTGRQLRAGLDSQARTALIGGTLLILISFITSYGDINLLRFTRLALHEQAGISLHLAALAALVGAVELASRLRDRAARRDRVENASLVAQCRFLHSGTNRNRQRQLNEALALLIEELNPGTP